MDVNDIKGLHAEVKKRMDATIEHVRKELSGLRSGRPSVSMLDPVQVEAYGATVPLNQVATLSVPEPTVIVAQPFDPSLMSAIGKAIQKRTSD
jgi:Ribosome recycling factor